MSVPQMMNVMKIRSPPSTSFTISPPQVLVLQRAEANVSLLPVLPEVLPILTLNHCVDPPEVWIFHLLFPELFPESHHFILINAKATAIANTLKNTR
jgi:hypothetical protein